MTTEEMNKKFKEKVLNNTMFDTYDRNIINNHLSNFFCVFALGYEEGEKSKLTDDMSEENLKKSFDMIHQEKREDVAYSYFKMFINTLKLKNDG